MKTIKILTLNLDPDRVATRIELSGYQERVTAALTKEFDDVEVEHYESTSHPDAPQGGHAFSLVGFEDPLGEIAWAIQEITGDIYEAGEFWV